MWNSSVPKSFRQRRFHRLQSDLATAIPPIEDRLSPPNRQETLLSWDARSTASCPSIYHVRAVGQSAEAGGEIPNPTRPVRPCSALGFRSMPGGTPSLFCRGCAQAPSTSCGWSAGLAGYPGAPRWLANPLHQRGKPVGVVSSAAPPGLTCGKRSNSRGLRPWLFSAAASAA
jgi:hypothetical protein